MVSRPDGLVVTLCRHDGTVVEYKTDSIDMRVVAAHLARVALPDDLWVVVNGSGCGWPPAAATVDLRGLLTTAGFPAPPDPVVCALCFRVEAAHGSWINSHRFTPAEPGEVGR